MSQVALALLVPLLQLPLELEFVELVIPTVIHSLATRLEPLLALAEEVVAWLE